MYLFETIATIFLVFILMLDWLTREEDGEKRYVDTEQSTLQLPKTNIGKQAYTTRPLGPSGRIIIDGEKYEALSDMGFIDKETQVDIVDIRYHQYVVRPHNKEY